MYLLDLPDSLKGKHQVFHASLLWKALNNPLPGQVVSPPPPVNITGDDKYKLTAIRAVKKHYTKLWYRGSWLGWDEDPEYYPASDFKYTPGLLYNFHLANPDLPGPPALLPDWLKVYDIGVDNYDHLDDDRAIDKTSRASFFQKGG